jgi:hypothetical protein
MTLQKKIDRLKEIEADCSLWGIWTPELGQAFDNAIKALKEGV